MRPPRCSRSRPLAGAIDSEGVVVDAKSGVSGAGNGAQGELARRLRAREPVAVRGRRAPTRPRDRAAARLPGHLRPASPADPARPPRYVLRQLGRRPSQPARRRVCSAARSSACCPRASSLSSPRVQGTRRSRDRALRGSLDGPRHRHLRDRQPGQGRRRAGGAERESRSRARRDPRAPPARSARLV